VTTPYPKSLPIAPTFQRVVFEPLAAGRRYTLGHRFRNLAPAASGRTRGRLRHRIVLKTAHSLGVSFPLSLLGRADEAIEWPLVVLQRNRNWWE
jgi:hypothetical protein